MRRELDDGAGTLELPLAQPQRCCQRSVKLDPSLGVVDQHVTSSEREDVITFQELASVGIHPLDATPSIEHEAAIVSAFERGTRRVELELEASELSGQRDRVADMGEERAHQRDVVVSYTHPCWRERREVDQAALRGRLDAQHDVFDPMAAHPRVVGVLCQHLTRHERRGRFDVLASPSIYSGVVEEVLARDRVVEFSDHERVSVSKRDGHKLVVDRVLIPENRYREGCGCNKCIQKLFPCRRAIDGSVGERDQVDEEMIHSSVETRCRTARCARVILQLGHTPDGVWEDAKG